MPFKSNRQRKWMFANKPRMAHRWARHSKNKKRGKRKNKK